MIKGSKLSWNSGAPSARWEHEPSGVLNAELPKCSQGAPNMPKLDRRRAGSLPGPPRGKFDIIHWDEDLPGFGLRILRSGSRAWIVRYRLGGKQRAVRLGRLEELSPSDARLEARRILAGVRLGRDEQAEIAARRSKAAARSEETLGAVISLYMQHVVRSKRPGTQVERKRHLERDWRLLHGRPARELSRRDVAARLLEIKDRQGPVAANRARASLNAYSCGQCSRALWRTIP